MTCSLDKKLFLHIHPILTKDVRGSYGSLHQPLKTTAVFKSVISFATSKALFRIQQEVKAVGEHDPQPLNICLCTRYSPVFTFSPGICSIAKAIRTPPARTLWLPVVLLAGAAMWKTKARFTPCSSASIETQLDGETRRERLNLSRRTNLRSLVMADQSQSIQGIFTDALAATPFIGHCCSISHLHDRCTCSNPDPDCRCLHRATTPDWGWWLCVCVCL